MSGEPLTPSPKAGDQPLPEVVVVDYGAANLLSITRALEEVGARVRITDDPAILLGAAGVVLPGVGAAGAAMARLRASGADVALRQVTAEGRPFLGICLGLQLLFERLEEDDATGLGILAGEVTHLPASVKAPHMGWNALTVPPDGPGAALFAGVRKGMYAYFVHSYACRPADPATVAAMTDYGGPVCAAVVSGSLWGCQFHPEKSGAEGLCLLANWVRQLSSQPTSTAIQTANSPSISAVRP